MSESSVLRLWYSGTWTGGGGARHCYFLLSKVGKEVGIGDLLRSTYLRTTYYVLVLKGPENWLISGMTWHDMAWNDVRMG